ncbi:phosphotransferase [Patescibacteria group bacterium]|nr:phosphotransferase [Patescibacteria group bacterium]
MKTVCPKEITNLLTKYGLTIIKPFRLADGGFKRSYVLLCKDLKGKKFVLKVFASRDKNAQSKFIREVKILLLLGKYKNLSSFVPKVYKHNFKEQKGSLYYLLEYFDYKSFGEFTLDLSYQMGIFKKDSFEVFMDFWQEVGDMRQEGLEWLSPYGLSRFMDELSFYKSRTPEILSLGMWERVFNYLKRREKTINDCCALSHLDLYPENIFAQESFSRDFKIIDWEQSHLTAKAGNEAFLYLMLWKEDYFRKKIFTRISEQGSMSSFKCFLLLFAVRFLYQTKSFAHENAFSESFKLSLLSTINDIVQGKFSRPRNLQYLVSKMLVRQLLKNFYSFKKDISVEDFPAGYGNTMLKISIMTGSDKNKDYVLRVYSLSRIYENIRREAKIYRHLSKKGIPTYFVCKNKERRLVSKAVIYGRERYFIFVCFLKGRTLSRTKLKKTHLYQAGSWLAKMHTVGVVHNDYNRRNVLYDKDVLSGIIDMEFSQFSTKSADHLRDLAKAIALWLQGIDDNASVSIREVYESFMGGYFGKNWKDESFKVNRLIVEELRKLRTEYRRMNKKSPSEYFEGIIVFINNLIPRFKV